VFAIRQVATGLFVTDVVLFLLAATFNDHSSTSVDGILWWLAIAVFVLLVMFGLALVVQYVRTRGRRPKRPHVR
jgi:ABC-type nickel/cobalt efflux system permease component RcnA